MKKERQYGRYRFKGIGTFIANNVILLKQYSNGSKIFIETALQKLSTGQSVPCPPYLIGITAPISLSQKMKIKLLREADNLGKAIPKELVGNNALYVKTYGDVKDPSGRASLEKDYKMMYLWVKKRYEQLKKDPSLSKYYN